MKASELIAKLEDGYVLEFRHPNWSDKAKFTGFYRVPATTYNGHPIAAYHEAFGWGSAMGTYKDRLLSIVTEPEMWRCNDRKPIDYGLAN